ncbi:MerR family transcriptional regulator [Arthrobacter crystallopoietes]|uniref:MerR family transcriptional regulator n=1 Tax=Crystallibacter crystallopoietes TaxID=37928 RepID=UPI001FCDE892|nr:MerR family transcriptional regulator [Arthrobacter crystallopoietes]
MLPPAERSANGYREYGRDTISRLEFIRRSQIAGLTLAQIQGILQIRDNGITHAPTSGTSWVNSS